MALTPVSLAPLSPPTMAPLLTVDNNPKSRSFRMGSRLFLGQFKADVLIRCPRSTGTFWIARERGVLPGVGVWTVVLANSAPGTLAEVRTHHCLVPASRGRQPGTTVSVIVARRGGKPAGPRTRWRRELGPARTLQGGAGHGPFRPSGSLGALGTTRLAKDSRVTLSREKIENVT
jgi:hypothetical protein